MQAWYKLISGGGIALKGKTLHYTSIGLTIIIFACTTLSFLSSPSNPLLLSGRAQTSEHLPNGGVNAAVVGSRVALVESLQNVCDCCVQRHDRQLWFHHGRRVVADVVENRDHDRLRRWRRRGGRGQRRPRKRRGALGSRRGPLKRWRRASTGAERWRRGANKKF